MSEQLNSPASSPSPAVFAHSPLPTETSHTAATSSGMQTADRVTAPRQRPRQVRTGIKDTLIMSMDSFAHLPETRVIRELQLARELAFAIGEAPTEHEALQTTLMKVCQSTGWRMGQAWLPHPSGAYLSCSSAWYADAEVVDRVQEFRESSVGAHFAPGVGLPGRVWSSVTGEWSEDVTHDPNFPRFEAAERTGLHAGMAVPVMANTEFVAVLEFFVFETRSEDRVLLDLVWTVATQLGHMMKRKRTEETLRQSEAELRALLSSIDDVVMVFDSEGRYRKIAPHHEELLYQSRREMIGKTFHELFPEAQADHFLAMVQKSLQSRRTVHFEYALLINGEEHWFSANLSPMSEDRVVWVARDITERKAYEDALARAKDTYHGIFQHAMEGIFQTDLQGRYISANPALAHIYGYATPEDLMNAVTNIAQQLYVDQTRRDEFARLLARNDMVSKFESQVRRKDGTVIWIAENARAVRDADGALMYYEGTVEDITERKWQEAQIEEQQARLQEINQQLQTLATQDGLTGLKNHRTLQEFLKYECARALRDGTPLSLLLLDVDHFKSFNDSYGHPAGDEVLRQVARLLEATARETDLVARYGGEEFAVVLPNTSEEGALTLAERFRTNIARYEWLYRTVTASVGVTTYQPPTAFDSFDEETLVYESGYRCPTLITEADKALYWSKTAGRNRVTHWRDIEK